MSGLAELLVRQGHQVSGSDLAEYALTRRLESLGVKFHQGHKAEHLGEAQVVVHSAAVKEDNPELAAARARRLTVLRRGEMLARLMEGHFQIAITGAHGKTSTTAMVAAILRAAHLEPTVVVGALWDSLGSNAILGRASISWPRPTSPTAPSPILPPRSASSPTWTKNTWTFTGIWPTFRRLLANISEGCRPRRRWWPGPTTPTCSPC